MHESNTIQAPPRSSERTSAKLDTITASLVARQSRSDDGSMSVPDQIEQMRAFCERQTPPWVVGGVYEERDVSGRRPLDKRHGLKRAVDDVEHGRSQVVLTAYFDRFVRSVATRAEVVSRVEKAQGRVVSLDVGQTSDATTVQWFQGNVLALVAEMYARQTGEKLVTSKQRNIDNGVPPFPRITPAYVKRADGTLEPHATFGPLVREACRLRATGKSYVALTKWLSERGLDMSVSGVESMLSSKLMIGEIHFGKFKPNLHAIDEPIIDRATWRKMHATRASRGRHAKSDRLLARQGVLVCETCGARMSIHSATSANKRSYSYYRCGDRLCTKPAIVSCDVADDFVRDEAIKLSQDVVGHASAVLELEDARVKREAAEEKLASTIRLLATLDSESVSREVLDELSAKRDVAVSDHERLLTLTTPDLTLSTSADWDALSLDAKRDVIRAVVARAVVAPGRGPDRIVVFGRTSEALAQ
jgi:DNA invertase Pin-like site-specific DNA recombinase